MRGTLIAVATVAVLAGCSTYDSLTQRVAQSITPYRITVVQGNFVSKEAAAQMQVGMSRAQVKQLLGTPLLTDMFHADRWDYVFYFKRGSTNVVQQRDFVVLFAGDRVASWSGGEDLPSNLELLAEIDGDKSGKKKAARGRGDAAPAARARRRLRRQPAPATPDTDAFAVRRRRRRSGRSVHGRQRGSRASRQSCDQCGAIVAQYASGCAERADRQRRRRPAARSDGRGSAAVPVPPSAAAAKSGHGQQQSGWTDGPAEQQQRPDVQRAADLFSGFGNGRLIALSVS